MSDIHPFQQVAATIRPLETSRITSLLNMYHQIPGEDARQFQFACERSCLLSDISPYQRSVNVNADGLVLDTGWIEPEAVGTILMFNRTGTRYTVNPTPEERALDASASVRIMPFGLYCHPASIAVFTPEIYPENGIVLYSPNTVARIEYVVLPK